MRPARSRQVALSVDGGRDGVGSRAEGDEERVALRVHHPPLVGGEGSTQQPLVLGEHLRVPVAAQLLEQPGRALDVREQEGDGPARELVHAWIVLRSGRFHVCLRGGVNWRSWLAWSEPGAPDASRPALTRRPVDGRLVTTSHSGDVLYT